MADFVLNPDTGEVSRQVVQYERVELGALEGDVNRTEAEYNDAVARRTQLESDLEAAREDEAAKGAAHEEAKSGLEAYHQVAGTQAGVDAASVEGGSEGEVVSDEAGTPEVVTF